jgi:hypothetical protein
MIGSGFKFRENSGQKNTWKRRTLLITARRRILNSLDYIHTSSILHTYVFYPISTYSTLDLYLVSDKRACMKRLKCVLFLLKHRYHCAILFTNAPTVVLRTSTVRACSRSLLPRSAPPSDLGEVHLHGRGLPRLHWRRSAARLATRTTLQPTDCTQYTSQQDIYSESDQRWGPSELCAPLPLSL